MVRNTGSQGISTSRSLEYQSHRCQAVPAPELCLLPLPLQVGRRQGSAQVRHAVQPVAYTGQ